MHSYLPSFAKMLGYVAAVLTEGKDVYGSSTDGVVDEVWKILIGAGHPPERGIRSQGNTF